MRKGLFAFVAVFALSFQPALAAGLEDSIKATLDDVAKATKGDVKYDSLSVDGESFQIQGLSISQPKEGGAKVTFGEVSGAGAKPAEGMLKLTVQSLTLKAIAVTPPANEKGSFSVESVVMEDSNLVNLIPKMVEIGESAKNDEDAANKVTALLTREGYAKTLAVTNLNLDVEGEAKVSLASMNMENLKAGSPDLFTMDKFAVSAPKVFDLMIDKVEATMSERLDSGMATKYLSSLTGISFKAGEQIKGETSMVLGGDSMTMEMQYGGKWHVEKTDLEVRPFMIDAPDQFRLDLEADLTGLPSLEEYLKIMESGAPADAQAMQILGKLALVNFKIRLEERGMIGRLLQMGGMMSGLGDKDAVVGMVEQQGKPQAAMVLGQAAADDIMGKVTAFLREGGALTIQIKPKGAPFGAAQGQQLAMAPDKTTELLDIMVTHEK